MAENESNDGKMEDLQSSENQMPPQDSAAADSVQSPSTNIGAMNAASEIKEPKMQSAGLSQEELASIGLGEDAGEFDMLVNQVKPKSFEQLNKMNVADSNKSIEMLLDVSLPVSIELGRTAMSIEEILNLGPGSIVELNKLAGEPVDLLVNEKLIAKGEVVVVDENFGIRITSMVSQQDRIKSLK